MKKICLLFILILAACGARYGSPEWNEQHLKESTGICQDYNKVKGLNCTEVKPWQPMTAFGPIVKDNTQFWATNYKNCENFVENNPDIQKFIKNKCGHSPSAGYGFRSEFDTRWIYSIYTDGKVEEGFYYVIRDHNAFITSRTALDIYLKNYTGSRFVTIRDVEKVKIKRID